MARYVRKMRNSMVRGALEWHARELKLELLSYRNVSVDRVQLAFEMMHGIDDRMAEVGAPGGDALHEPTGMFISVWRRQVRTNTSA